MTKHRIQCIKPFPIIEFNPQIEEHRKAYLMLAFQGRQHPTLRFSYNPTIENSVIEHMTLALMKMYVPSQEFEKAKSAAEHIAKQAVSVTPIIDAAVLGISLVDNVIELRVRSKQ